ncbi:YeeE/YedE family protein [Vibrio sp. CAU 1672]|uniref:YeeE/YedE family protein n=1 Tax=Vibrio sp. CAU 1672 TaxID=3032594 RepID=UPI0023DCD23F|nr:YeeE/YedE family protein [Vibrio sp. CAU 1672]MDF2154505.1 YeeE/YedE family protein [Vibrio sp. CAU 1672]
MQSMFFRLSALFSGVLFGIGMSVSEMINPTKVIGFLDVFGNWDPSLAFVMGGALAVFMPSYLVFIKPRKRTLSGQDFCMPAKNRIDRKLISGAAVFGLGWGLVGICPGPVVASLALGSTNIVMFFVAMLVGSLLTKFVMDKRSSNEMQPAEAQ